jgi:hypothetical protein
MRQDKIGLLGSRVNSIMIHDCPPSRPPGHRGPAPVAYTPTPSNRHAYDCPGASENVREAGGDEELADDPPDVGRDANHLSAVDLAERAVAQGVEVFALL